jgi:hypothetical protein
VTFGAATSVLLTVLENVFGVRRYKKDGGLDGILTTVIAGKIKKPTSLVGYRVRRCKNTLTLGPSPRGKGG